MSVCEFPKLILPEWFDAQTEFEMEFKGYLNGATVEVEDGRKFNIFFIDPIRLSQDLETENGLGRPVLAEPGMVVLPKVTLSNISRALIELNNQGFFNQLLPC